MEPGEDPEFDAQMSELMGFSSFGMKPDAKKRKTAHDDPPIPTQFSSTGSNAIPIGQNGYGNHQITHQFAPNPSLPPKPTASSDSVPAATQVPREERSSFPTGVPMDILNKLTWAELEAYRKGVRNEKGDLGWFLPSFIEDPWAKLEKMKENAS